MHKKLLLEQYMSMKTMLQATKSAYFTSVASEMSCVDEKWHFRHKIGPEGDKKCDRKFHSEAETALSHPKRAGVHVM